MESQLNKDRLEELADETEGSLYLPNTKNQIKNLIYNEYREIYGKIDPRDTDGDKLPDIYEICGIHGPNGRIFYSDPRDEESDSDNLLDGEEMGPMRTREQSVGEYTMWVNDFPYVKGDPTIDDTDDDGYNDDMDEKPFDKPVIYKKYIFCQGRDADLTIAFEGFTRKFAGDLTFQNAEFIKVSTIAEFENEWNKMGLNISGKGEYGISDVYTVFHGGPNSFKVGTNEKFTIDKLKNNELIDKKIGTLHLESCNNGNLDYLNDSKLNDFKQNIAITFMKSCPNIKKVIAWDGFAHYFLAEWATGGGEFDTYSIKKHGCTRVPEGQITYTRTQSGIDYDTKIIHLYKKIKDGQGMTHIVLEDTDLKEVIK